MSSILPIGSLKPAVAGSAIKDCNITGNAMTPNLFTMVVIGYLKNSVIRFFERKEEGKKTSCEFSSEWLSFEIQWGWSMRKSPWLLIGSLANKRVENLVDDRQLLIWSFLNARQQIDSTSNDRMINWFAADIKLLWSAFNRAR